MRRLLTLPLLLLASATASCSDETSVQVKYANGYQPAPGVVSVFGVFRDGRMSVDSWGPIATPLSTALGALVDRCEPAFGERLQHENEELFSSIDDDVRNNGITEELLGKLAPRAQGELILTISVHGAGQTSTTDKHSPAGRTPAMTPPMRGAGGGRGPRGGNYREASPRGPVIRPLELTASLYSVRLHQPVARLSLSYTGSSTEEAIRRFTTEIGAMVPGASCKGWTFPPSRTPSSVAPLLEGP